MLCTIVKDACDVKILKTRVKSKSDDNEYMTFLWWLLLVSIAMVNISLWMWSYQVVDKNQFYQRAHLKLSGIYTFVCFYRSIMPRIDLERYTLVDTWLSNVILGRSAATIAEISFACQVALSLYELSEKTQLTSPLVASWFVVPALTMAQVFCWCGVVTLNHFFHAIEESLWTITFASVGLSLAPVAIYETGALSLLAFAGCIFSVIYVAFMATVDVPMYVQRWVEHRQSGKPYMSFRVGKKDAWQRRVVTWTWNVWKHEAAWLTGYFSFAVWTSLALVHIPRT
jgi:hypothetical protein